MIKEKKGNKNFRKRKCLLNLRLFYLFYEHEHFMFYLFEISNLPVDKIVSQLKYKTDYLHYTLKEIIFLTGVLF